MTVSEKLRLVQGLHSHAEMFGFNWDDGSDWTWHDVACKIADEVDAENDRLREVVSDGEENARLILHESRVLQAENAKLRESLENAAGIIAGICGECPVSRYEWLSSDGCAEKCGTVTEEECWIAYLTGKRWDESGVEADG